MNQDGEVFILPATGLFVGLILLVISSPMILHPNDKARLVWESVAPMESRS